MAKDAIEAWVLTALRFGDEIPEIDARAIVREAGVRVEEWNRL